jgi:hypothetical protein
MPRQTPEDFGAAFEFRRSAFRLELLDKYVAANEAEPFRRFLNGEPHNPAWREPWAQFVRESVRDGKRMARVHVVREPLSDYLKFELTRAYPANVTAGEDVRILEISQYPELSPPSRDFWLFDERNAAVMDYDQDGNFLGADATSDPALVGYYLHVRDLTVNLSVPLADYLASTEMKEAV